MDRVFQAISSLHSWTVVKFLSDFRSPNHLCNWKASGEVITPPLEQCILITETHPSALIDIRGSLDDSSFDNSEIVHNLFPIMHQIVILSFLVLCCLTLMWLTALHGHIKSDLKTNIRTYLFYPPTYPAVCICFQCILNVNSSFLSQKKIWMDGICMLKSRVSKHNI